LKKIIVYFHAVLGSVGTKDGRRRKNVFRWMLTKILWVTPQVDTGTTMDNMERDICDAVVSTASFHLLFFW
jgi:hypothetical protein